MAQYEDDDDEPSGLVKGAKNLYDKVTGTLNKMPPYERKTEADPDMVREANESFKHPVQTKAQQKKASPKASTKVNVKGPARKRD